MPGWTRRWAEGRQRSTEKRGAWVKVEGMPGLHSRKKPKARRARWALVVILVLGGAGAAVWKLSQPNGHSHQTLVAGPSTTSVATTTVTTAQPVTTATLAPTVVSSQTSTSAAAIPAPTTTVPLGSPVSAPGSYTYTLPAGTAVTVSATLPCWIESAQSAGGTIQTDTVLQAGQTASFTVPVWIRLGDPTHVKVLADGTSLQLPALSGDLIIESQ